MHGGWTCTWWMDGWVACVHVGKRHGPVSINSPRQLSIGVTTVKRCSNKTYRRPNMMKPPKTRTKMMKKKIRSVCEGGHLKKRKWRASRRRRGTRRMRSIVAEVRWVRVVRMSSVTWRTVSSARPCRRDLCLLFNSARFSTRLPQPPPLPLTCPLPALPARPHAPILHTLHPV